MIPKRVRTSTIVKRVGTPLYQAAARCVTGLPGPRILANSPPKAGTHVLSTLLDQMPKVMFSGRHYNPNDFRIRQDDDSRESRRYDWSEIERQYGRVRPGQYATGHFPASPEFQEIVHRLDLRTIVIFRDPRDMVVSAAHYIRGLKRHPLHEIYRAFGSVEEAVDAAMSGVSGPDGRGHPSIADRIAGYLPWLDDERVLTVRFEDLVGENGGGSRSAQLQAVSDIAAHIERPLSGAALQAVCDKVFAPTSATFRKGQIADWKNHLTDEQVERFRIELGDQLIRLGYENSLHW